MDPRGRAGRWHNCFSSIQLHNSVTKMFDDFFFDIFLIFVNFDFFRKMLRFFFNQTLYTSSECSSRGAPGFNLMTNDVPKHRERFWGAGWTQFSASWYQPLLHTWQVFFLAWPKKSGSEDSVARHTIWNLIKLSYLPLKLEITEI